MSKLEKVALKRQQRSQADIPYHYLKPSCLPGASWQGENAKSSFCLQPQQILASPALLAWQDPFLLQGH